jgi:hypothetical protein
LAVRASKKLRNDELLVTAFAGTSLRGELDRIPLWRGNHVSIKQLTEDFARYVYLPRLAEPAVLFSAIRDGLGLLTWEKDSFAYADDYDETASRYRGLRCGQVVNVASESSTGLLVRPEVAKLQQAAEMPSAGPTDEPNSPKKAESGARPEGESSTSPKPSTACKRFHGSVELDPTRVGRDAGRIADEVIAHLAGLMGATVKVTLDIAAEIPSGAPDHVVRTVLPSMTIDAAGGV